MADFDGAGESILAACTREIDSANYLDRLGLALVTYLEDQAYALSRLADQVGETYIHPSIHDRFEHVVAVARHLASYADDQLGRPLIMRGG